MSSTTNLVYGYGHLIIIGLPYFFVAQWCQQTNINVTPQSHCPYAHHGLQHFYSPPFCSKERSFCAPSLITSMRTPHGKRIAIFGHCSQKFPSTQQNNRFSLLTPVRPTKVGNAIMTGIGSRQNPHTP
jgi:hypothetical protein